MTPDGDLLEGGFRVRGTAPSRLEAFSDAVFAFAVTLLVVSLDVPRTFDELLQLMSGFVGFAFSFAMIILLWRTHARFFRRFALEDGATVALNSVLLFLVLFFVYPLKFLFTALFSQFSGGPEAAFARAIDGPTLMLLYGGGFAAVFVVFGLMYLHALRRADVLGLSPEERARTRTEAEAMGLMAAIGGLSIAVAQVPSGLAQLSGFVYFLIAPALAAHGYVVGRWRLNRALAAEAAATPAADALAADRPVPVAEASPEEPGRNGGVGETPAVADA